MNLPPRRGTPALLQVGAILDRLSGAQALGEVARFLRAEFSHYAWIGFYRLDGEELVLVAYEGAQATEHVRIPLARGICGQAAREDRTVIVGDVSAHPEYLACFIDTRSEIVVPIRANGRVIGEIDIDGRTLNAYDASDRTFLEEVSRRVAPAMLASATLPLLGGGAPSPGGLPGAPPPR
jgi:L-methionine (R)-S-oxide reductase